MKVVFDTNVLVSATIWKKSVSHKLLLKLIDKNVSIFTSMGILKEFEKVLIRDFKYSDKEVMEKVKELLNTVIVAKPVELVNAIRDDETDNRILECAIAVNADYILSYDNHLLKLGLFRNIKILKPEQLGF